MRPINVLIVDDQHLFAESLRFVLHGESSGRIEVVGIAENGREAVELVEAHEPDVVLMDIRMPVMDGVDATAAIHARWPDIEIMILTTFDDDELAVSALSHGATAYVLKDVDPPDLIRSIEAVHDGAFYISRSVGQKLVEIVKMEGIDRERLRSDVAIELIERVPSLTRREAEILYLAAQALTNKSIAEELFLSEKTVKNHMSSIYRKVGVHNRLQVIQFVSKVRKSAGS
jgi:DNA-binding NarL/FixJ family response regulator